jgi:zinc protease
MNRRYRAVLAFVVALATMLPVAFGQTNSAPQKAKPQAQAAPGDTAQKTAAKTVTTEKTAAKPWTKIPIPPLPAFHPPIPKRIELPNGMVVMLQEDHELPLISATARIRGGSRLEPAEKTGLVDMYGDVWRTGGTKSMTGDQMDDFLEARAAKIETDGGADSTSISLDCMKQDFDDVFKLFVDLMHNPAFREDKLKLEKKQMDTMISRRNDDIGSIAGREAVKLAYGSNNPYARVAEYATVAAVGQQDLAQWHDHFAHPNNILLGVVGDFDSAQMEQKIRAAFGDWPKGEEIPSAQIAFTPAKPGLYYVPKEDVNQSEIQMVTLGIERSNPDYFAITVMNELFGGGFSSRLFKNIRTKAGLAYSVGGGIGSAWDHPGVFRIAMGTKTVSTADAIKALNQQIQDLITDPPTEAELKLAKDSILNSFVFNFDSPDKVLHERMAYEYYGYPQNFLEMYREGVEKVTGADVVQVAKKYVHPGQFAVLVVGNPDEAKPELAKLGPYTTIDITIPPPSNAASAMAAPKSTTLEGKALMAKVVEGLGGAAKLQATRALRENTTRTIKTPQGEIALDVTTAIEFPDRMAVVMTTPGGEMKQVITPTAAFMSFGNQSRDLPSTAKQEGLNAIKHNPVFVAQHADDPKFIFATAAPEKIGEVQAQVLEISADGTSMRWWVDPQTGHILREQYQATGQQGPVQRTVENAEWKTFDGLNLPTDVKISENGEESGKVTLKTVQINPELDPKDFEKPAASTATATPK